MKTLLSLVLVVLLSCAAVASGTEDYPSQEAPPHLWQGTLRHGKVRAAVRVQCPEDRAATAAFQVSGLQPGARYSFWMVLSDGRLHRLGAARAGASQPLRYKARLHDCPQGDRITVQIDRRASAKKRVAVLRGVVAAVP